jgi:small subunit ribosomal protein S13
MKNSIIYYFSQTYGINKSLAYKMCFFIGVSPVKSYKQVAEFKKEQAFMYLKAKKNLTGFELKNKELSSLRFYETIGNIKGFKFKAGLPIRGQRNKTNGKNAKKNAFKLYKMLSVSQK